jgi:cytochrome c biogenesis protein CcmG/thiol:disulfide interchange protein DsbE
MNVRLLIAPLFALSLLAGCASGKAGSSAAPPQFASVGQPAPAFEEPKVDGGTLSLASLKGKPVYLNFFATWCPPCNEEAADVNAVQHDFAARGLQVVGVNVLENAKKAKSFVDLHHLTYPAVVDDGALRDAYRINGMPVHVFIDRQGIVRKIAIGELTKAEMTADVRTIL